MIDVSIRYGGGFVPPPFYNQPNAKENTMKTERRGFLKGLLALGAPVALCPTQDINVLKVPETPKAKPKPVPIEYRGGDCVVYLSDIIVHPSDVCALASDLVM
jgi:hypothetical protein